MVACRSFPACIVLGSVERKFHCSDYIVSSTQQSVGKGIYVRYPCFDHARTVGCDVNALFVCILHKIAKGNEVAKTMLGSKHTYTGRSTRRHLHPNVGVQFAVPSTAVANPKLLAALRRLDSRSRNEFPNSDVIMLESKLNTGKSSKKCKLQHEIDSYSEDQNTNTVTVVPCDSISTKLTHTLKIRTQTQ